MDQYKHDSGWKDGCTSNTPPLYAERFSLMNGHVIQSDSELRLCMSNHMHCVYMVIHKRVFVRRRITPPPKRCTGQASAAARGYVENFFALGAVNIRNRWIKIDDRIKGRNEETETVSRIWASLDNHVSRFSTPRWRWPQTRRADMSSRDESRRCEGECARASLTGGASVRREKKTRYFFSTQLVRLDASVQAGLFRAFGTVLALGLRLGSVRGVVLVRRGRRGLIRLRGIRV